MVSVALDKVNSCKELPVRVASKRTREVFPDAGGPTRIHIQPLETQCMAASNLHPNIPFKIQNRKK